MANDGERVDPTHLAGAAATMTAVRPQTRPDRTMAWIAAKLLLAAGFVALGIASYVAWKPVVNPQVQDCGSPMGFFLTNRQNVVLFPGEPGAPPNAVALGSQPTCRELAETSMAKAGLAGAAFVGLTLAGVLVGLLDDRIGYWSAPRFESLLRDMPTDARIRHGLIPNVDVDDLGAQLPPLESPEIWALAGFGLVTFVALPFLGPLEATQATLDRLSLVPVLAAMVLMVIVAAAATLQRKALYPVTESWGRTLAVVAATSWVGRLRPLVTSFGIDVHHLRRTGAARADAVLDVQVLQTVSLLGHLALLAVAALVARTQPFTAIRWDAPELVLVAVIVVLLVSGVSRAPRRWRALPVRPGLAGVTGIGRVAATPVQLGFLVGGTVAISLVNAGVLALALAAFGASEPFAFVLFAYLVAVVAGALSPTPDGVGVIEGVLVLLLLKAGLEPASAVLVTLTYRLVSCWLPMLPGLVAARRLRAADAL